MLIQVFDENMLRLNAIDAKNIAIEKNLNTADQTIEFEYPTTGIAVDDLKTEYYLRTKNDEYVLKELQTGDHYNKYVATINVESLEGKVYESGYETVEKTPRECLLKALEGTGWSIGSCSITKRRTIRKEEACSAWDILQDVIKTYRVEVKLDSINKIINVYEEIGADRGCVFVEGINLKQIEIKSDTYNFATRLIPIGKDGLHLWENQKNYIENHQYSNKVITHVWKDERYTNTTSLLEDATAKLNEMSKPYRAYTVKVIDLARCSDKFKEAYQFDLGDTVTLISKKTGVKEKMRIVKIKQYPDSPENNEAELSNVNKTFAEVQKEEQEITKQEAIMITKKQVNDHLSEDYSTTEEVETLIGAFDENIRLDVKKTYQTKAAMTDYSTTRQIESMIELSVAEIELSVSDKYQTKSSMSDYSTTSETKALIKLKADEINSEVSKKVNNSEFYTKITQNAYAVRVAWNGNSNYIQLEYGSIGIYNGEVSSAQKRAMFDENGEHFYRDGYYVGKIGTNQYSSDNSKKGLVFDLESQAAYMTWANKASSSASSYTMRWTYVNKAFADFVANRLYAGCDIDMQYFTLRNVNFEGGGINGTLNFVQVMKMDSNGTVARWSNGCQLTFKNGILVSGTWSS